MHPQRTKPRFPSMRIGESTARGAGDTTSVGAIATARAGCAPRTMPRRLANRTRTIIRPRRARPERPFPPHTMPAPVAMRRRPILTLRTAREDLDDKHPRGTVISSDSISLGMGDKVVTSYRDVWDRTRPGPDYGPALEQPGRSTLRMGSFPTSAGGTRDPP